MSYLNHNGYKFFYEIQGEGKISLFFIHGLCGDHRVWLKNIPAFANKYRVVSIDMFGHGQSSDDISPQKAFESTPTVIENLIKKARLENVVLIGHSIAGNILSDCIEEKLNNVIGYVFLDCTFNATKRVVSSRNKLADTLLNNPSSQLQTAIIEWYKTMMNMDASFKDNELILSAVENINGQWAMDFLKATNIIRQAPKTNLPVLIFESDWLIKDEPERSFYKVMPQSDYCHWYVPYHFFFVYDAQKFNSQLQNFLDKYYSVV